MKSEMTGKRDKEFFNKILTSKKNNCELIMKCFTKNRHFPLTLLTN